MTKEEVSFLEEASTIVDILSGLARTRKCHHAFHFLVRNERTRSVSYGELEMGAKKIASLLQTLAEPGDRILLLYPPGIEYITAFFGCLFAGAVAVPLYPPRPNNKLERISRVVLDCQPVAALTVEKHRPMIAALFDESEQFSNIHVLATDQPSSNSSWPAPSVTKNAWNSDVAFLQYTSGSTGTPKGVTVTHANIMANQKVIQRGFRTQPDDIGVNWLPIYHDMGLIGTVLHSLFEGIPSFLMSPSAFIQDPVSWLEAITRYRGTICGGPNFGYELLLQKITPERLKSLDLSSWRLAFNGAEPVRASTLRAFTETFTPAGFRPEIFYPCYGMAEATLFITGVDPRERPSICYLDKEALRGDRVLELGASDEDPKIAFVACGRPASNHRVLIVDPESKDFLGPDRIGEIWVQGPSVAGGYWHSSLLTEETFGAFLAKSEDGPFLRTGDLGFLKDGELYITGRMKDLMIIRGRNHYPQDIEQTVERCHSAFRAGGSVAFTISVDGEERLVVIQEIERARIRKLDRTGVVRTVRAVISDHHELQAHAVVLVKPGAVPRTSSGKLQRFQTKRMYVAAKLRVIGEHKLDEAVDPDSVESGGSPANQVEALLVEIWSRALKRRFLSPNTNFLEEGGDSLAALQILSQIRELLGFELEPRHLFEAPSPVALARLIESARQGTRLPKITRKPLHRAILSFGQQRLYFLEQLERLGGLGTNATYNNPATVLLSGSLPVLILERCIEKIVQRHESLRTVFREDAGQFFQLISESRHIPVVVIDLRNLGASMLNSESTTLAALDAGKPFDLEQGPLLRVSVLRLADQEHILQLNIHHLISDAWSMEVFQREWVALYHSMVRNIPAHLPKLDIQYSDFAIWQRKWLTKELRNAQLGYWRRALKGAPPLLELPTDFARPAVQSYVGNVENVALDPSTLIRLKNLENLTPFMIFQAAFAILLARHSNQTDIVLGSPIANRGQKALDHLIGFFVNTLPLRLQILPDDTFATLLNRVRTSDLESFAHQDLPFDQLVDELLPHRDPGFSPLFQVMFIYQKDPLYQLKLPGLDISSVQTKQVIAKVDLTLAMVDTGKGLRAFLEYNTDLFNEDRIRRMARHYGELLDKLAARSDTRLSHFSILTRKERRRILGSWSHTTRFVPDLSLLHKLFERWAEQSPNAEAVVFGDRIFSYGELDRSAARVARDLRDRGVRRETPIGLFCERNPEFLMGLLGIFKAGGTHVPIDVSLPSDRVKLMIDQCGIRLLLTQGVLLDKIEGESLEKIGLDTYLDAGAEDAGGLTHSQILAAQLAYIIFTSGSTGTPKGVGVTHREATSVIAADILRYGIGPGDRLSFFVSIGFDASIFQAFTALGAGAALYPISGDPFSSSDGLIPTLKKGRVTRASFPPSVLTALSENDFPDLKTIIVGAEPCAAELVERWARNRCFFNAYGPTETTITATVARCRPSEMPTIGFPVENVEVYITDGNLQPVPVGVPGELLIGGSAPARGYISQPAMTAERFIPNPFSTGIQEPGVEFGSIPEKNGARIYKTGDRVRWLEDGRIDFMGRLDFQIKYCGYRIEPAEIECNLMRHGNIEKSLVLLREDTVGQKRLVAYVVECEPGIEASYREFLRASLPEYMIPSHFISLARFPLTPSGKINRGSLPVPETGQGSVSKDGNPRTTNEEKLVRVWRRVLGIENVGIHDNFFMVGGDSIQALQVISGAKKLGLTLRPNQLFEKQTIAELARVAGLESPIRTEEKWVTGALPLTPIQHWFLDIYTSGDRFHQMVVFEVAGNLDPDILEQALNAVIRHHDALRLRYKEGDCQEHGILEETAALVTRGVEDGTDFHSTFNNLIETLHADICLRRGPLFRAGLVLPDRGPGGRLVLTCHHWAVDGVSWRILIEDLVTVYRQLIQGRAFALPSKSSSFQSWAHHLARFVAANELERDYEFWLDTLRVREEEAAIPFEKESSPERNTFGSAHAVKVSFPMEETDHLLREIPKAYKTRLEEVLLTALVRIFHAPDKSLALRLDIENHGRVSLFPELDISRTVGWFTSFHPMVLTLPKIEDPGEDLKSIKEQMRCIPNQGIGWGLLRYMDSGVTRRDKLAALPRAQFIFNYLGQIEEPRQDDIFLAWLHEPGGLVTDPRLRRPYSLEMTSLVRHGKLEITWVYDSHAFTRVTMEALADRFLARLKQLVDHALSPEAGGFTPSDFPLARLNQETLDRLSESFREEGLKPEDIYPLSHVQEGLLYHSLLGDAPSAYLNQLSCRLKGVDISRFKAAWEYVCARHPVLRTSFHWSGLDRPLQVVHGKTVLVWRGHDWRDLPEAQRGREQDAVLTENRKRGFQLDKAPLQRFHLFQLCEKQYWLVWEHHHLLMDGWSCANLMKEVFSSYASLSRKETPVLPYAAPYRPFIQWLESRDRAEAESFWREELAGLVRPTSLPFTHSKSSEPAEMQIVMPAELEAALESFIRRERLTLNTLFQGAWSILLSRYSDTKEVLFGTTISGRDPDIPNANTMVGVLINTVPVRVSLEGEKELAPWLARLQDRQVQRDRHGYASLTDIMKWVGISRDTELFDSLVVVENYPLDELPCGNENLPHIDQIRALESTHYPLTLVIVASSPIRLQIKYNAMAIERSMARRLLNHLVNLVRSFTTNARKRPRDYELMEGDERRLLLQRTETDSTTRLEQCAHELFRIWADRRPAALAVVAEGVSWTYSMIERRSDEVAKILAGLGIGPEKMVGICMPQSVQSIIATMATLKTGGAYLPLDPEFPARRIKLMLEDAKAEVLLTRVLSPQIEESSICSLALGSDGIPADRSTLNYSTALPDPNRLSFRRAAYVIYTSGSSGKPKGVAVSHRSLLNLVNWHISTYAVDENQRASLLAGPAFDASVWEMWPYLSAGASLHIPPGETRLDPVALCNWIDAERISIAFCVTPLAHSLLEKAPPSKFPRILLTGGDKLRVRPLPEWEFQLFNHYGPTENTVVTTASPVAPGAKADAPSIGRPISHVRTYVLDSRFKLTPIGIEGELCIGGESLARGYLNQPGLTAASFVANPFGGPGDRLYKTGDRVWHLPDGDLAFGGRIDNQIKLRGFRIELGEIESMLCQRDDVAEAVALKHEFSSGPALVAYLRPRPDLSKIDTVAVTDFLRLRLPPAMVPSQFQVLPEFPMTPNGKIDHRALPPFDSPTAAGDSQPRNELESILAGIWADVLGTERVGIHDDFYELGGHSLLATRIVSRIRWMLHLDLPLRNLFEERTIAGLARTLSNPEKVLVPAFSPIMPRMDRRRACLSASQRGLWLFQQKQPHNPAYNISLFIEIEGDFQPVLLERSMINLTERHEALRTSFPETEEEPYQAIAETTEVPLTLVDLSRFGTDIREREAHRLARGEARRPFLLSTGPLLRCTLLDLGMGHRQLLLTMHHIISDGWSVGILVREFSQFYEAHRRGFEISLPPIELQYADYAEWQRKWLMDETFERYLDYWRGKFADPSPPLELPMERPRPRLQTHRGGTVQIHIAEGLLEGVRRFGRQRGATAYSYLLAVFSLLLSRYSHQHDLVIGSGAANRNRLELESVFGFFVNMIPLRIGVDGRLSFSEFLKLVRHEVLNAQTYQEAPLEKVLEALSIERDPGRTPLFQVVFDYQDMPLRGVTISGRTLRPVFIETESAKFDLCMSLLERESEVIGFLEYNADLFERGTACRLVGHFQNLLARVVEDPDRSCADYELIDADERERLLGTWNNTYRNFPLLPIHVLFQHQALHTPEMIAAGCASRGLSYQQLDQASNHLASRLRRLGAGPETNVGVLAERSLESVTAFLAIAKTGGAYVPLDPKYPESRRNFILEDVDAAILLGHRDMAVPPAGVAFLPFDEGLREGKVESVTSGPHVDAECLAYVVYTSGTTGQPKGVAIPHRAIVRLVMESDYLSIKPGDRVGHASNIAFDAATFEIWGALLNGAAIVIFDQYALSSPQIFASLLREQGVDVLFLTTALLNQLVAEIPHIFACVETLLFGGEAVDPNRIRTLMASGAPSRLLHVYGPTESTTYAAWQHVGEVACDAYTIPIGQPIANTEIHLFDPDMRLSPVGIHGDLLIGGEGLARGYFRNPALTAGKFIPHPLALRPGARLYRTGDLVRREPEGAIAFIGRRDHQVKLRGFRIELAEVEAALARLPAVGESVVLLREDLPGDKRLVAYLTLDKELGQNLDHLKLSEQLARELPGYMIPSEFVYLEAFPLTPNGKIDRRLLPVPETRGRLRLAPPRTPTEKTLLTIWRAAMVNKDMGIHDDFFSLGGHSLMATKIISQVYKTEGVKLTIENLFKAPNVAALAGLVDRLRKETQEFNRLPPLQHGPIAGKVPLSFAQQRLWFMDILEANPAYHLFNGLKLTGLFDPLLLVRAVNEIIARHESLRTTFVQEDDEPIQLLAPRLRISIPIIDLRSIPKSSWDGLIHGLSAKSMETPFDLRHGPLLRCQVIILDRDLHVLLTTMHHIITDGVSMGIFIRELDHFYTAFQDGRKPGLQEVEYQYGDFALWQRNFQAGKYLDAQLAFWERRLADPPPPLELPSGKIRPRLPSHRGGALYFGFGPELTDRLVAFSSDRGVTVFVTLLTAFKVLLFHNTRRQDIVVGTVSANRNLPELETMIGYFVNPLVLRTDLGNGSMGPLTFTGLLDRVSQTVTDAYENQDVPFEMLVDKLQPRRDLSHSPLFQVIFTYHGLSIPKFSRFGSQLIETDFQAAQFDLAFEMMEPGTTDDTIQGLISYRKDLFDRFEIQNLAVHFTRILEGAVARPNVPFRDLPWLTPAEKHGILVAWNDSVQNFPREWHLPGLVEAWSARAPETVAMVSEYGNGATEALTFAQLEESSNRLAHGLIARGVGPDTLVALLDWRGLDFACSVLGVFKSGAAYLPLDPSHPESRQRRILDGSGVPFVLVSRHFSATARALCDSSEVGVAVLDLKDLLTDERPLTKTTAPVLANYLAYAIFTSGSTGKPKGVLVEHGGMINHLRAKVLDLELTAADAIAQNASQCFDISIWQFWAAPMVGGRTHIFDDKISKDPRLLVQKTAEAKISILEVVPSLLAMVLDQSEQTTVPLPGLRWLIPTGEALAPELTRLWLKVYPQIPLLNAYGPTECSDDVSHLPIAKPIVSAYTPIGRPIANTRLYILDSWLNPVPMRVAGELLVGGIGIGRGYLGDPVKTAVTFIPDVFNGDPERGGRLYRTGDLARFCPNGEIECLGRIDHQVKIRGYRIELGEIEALLVKQDGIREAAVVVREGLSDAQQLVAYVAAEPGGPGELPERATSDRWREIWDQIYRQDAFAEPDPFPNKRVWVSSYSGEPYSEGIILEAVDNTVERILALDPRVVFEIGCGTGLILSKVAPHCQRYDGTDISQTGLDALQNHVELYGSDWPEMNFCPRAADDFSGLEEDVYDTVILNEVAQYLPSVEYLCRVLDGAVRLVKPGGTVFIGGVRNLELLEAFHLSVLLEQSEPKLSAAHLLQRLQDCLSREKELLASPELFYSFGEANNRIGHVQVELQGGRTPNELSKFRYDVVLFVNPVSPVGPPELCLDWQQCGALKEIRWVLDDRAPESLLVKAIPNSRVARELGFLKLIREGEPTRPLAEVWRAWKDSHPGLDPNEFLEVDTAYRVHASWSRENSVEYFDVVYCGSNLCNGPIFPTAPTKAVTRVSDWSRYANQPMKEALGLELATSLRRSLTKELPEYMVPVAFVVLDEFPLTVNGKIDRNALPKPGNAYAEPDPHQEPQTPTEGRLAGIWAKLLGFERVGIHRNFFEIGGHSLLATRLVSRIRTAFGVDLPLHEVFQAPTVAALASRIDALARERAGESSIPIMPQERNVEIPLSFSQRRLWFVDRLAPGQANYNIPAAIRLTRLFSKSIFEKALQEIIQRHEPLRARFVEHDGKPYQEFDEAFQPNLPVADLRLVDSVERDWYIQRLAVEEARRPFDLVHGPLIRFTLILWGQEERTLLLTMHHIISDGWSLGVFINEVAEAYEGFLSQRQLRLPELKITYADFAFWQQDWLNSEAYREHRDYWKRQLAGLPPHLELPTDKSRPRLPSARGVGLPFSLSERTNRRLKQLGLRENATLFMTMLAGFKLLLRRYSGQEDIVVGTPVANRNRAEVEGLIGFFVNTLVMRTSLKGPSTFRELVGRTRETALGAFEHQDMPFERLVEELQPDRDLSRNPLFQANFLFQNFPRNNRGLSGLSMTLLDIDYGLAHFDLTIALSETPTANGRTIGGQFIYQDDLFERKTVESMVGHYALLLDQAAAEPDCPISHYRLLGETEWSELCGRFDHREKGPADEVCLHTMIEAWAKQTPDSVALVHETHENGSFWSAATSYSHLNGRANQIARYLRQVGIGAENRVGLFMNRNADAVSAILGIFKAGAAYVPVDPLDPRERQDLVFKVSGVSLIMSEEVHRDRMPDMAPILILDTQRNPIDRFADHDPEFGVDSRQLCFLMFTSGSTGRPKGVANCHRSLTRFITTHQRVVYSGLREPVNLSMTGRFNFDASVKQLAQMGFGGRVHLVPDRIRRDGKAMLTFMDRHRLDVVDCTPSLLRLLIGDGLLDRRSGTPKRFLLAGEAIDPDLWKRLADHPTIGFFNTYGPTETTVVATACLILDGMRPHLGQPFAGEVLVLDENFEPAAPGIPGEIGIAGVPLSRGYHGEPALTSAVYVPHPRGRSGDRVYRTGDRGRVRWDGRLEYLGRFDHQVKLRGIRLELGELESLLMQHPRVKISVALVREDTPADQRLVAYAAVGDWIESKDSLEQDLRRLLETHLPTYMLPGAIVLLPSLPLTPNGKVDRRALPQPDGLDRNTYVAPRNQLDADISDIWCQVIGIPRVGIHDNFFEIGGHSLLATQIAAKVQQTWQIELNLIAIFNNPTVAGIADAVEILRTVERTDNGPTGPGHINDMEEREEGML